MNDTGGRSAGESGAKVLVVLLAFAWGFNWTAVRIALDQIPPWSLRFAGIGIGAATLFAVAYWRRVSLVIPRGQRLHIMAAGFFNVAAFNILAAFAQMGTATSRVVIVAYSMPIWGTLLARVVLGERLNAVRLLALLLCAAGLAVLVQPLLAGGWPIGVFYSLICALSWAAGTVYVKWAKVDAAPLTIAAWQLLFGWLMVTVGMLAIEGLPQLWPISIRTMTGLFYNGLIGFGIAYLLWFTIITRLPATTASIGSLMVPVVGVVVSTVILGERPTLSDIVGFTLIFAAAACVLLQPRDTAPVSAGTPR